MKLSRKILSLVLALVMVMGLAATAFAEEGGETTTESGSITIKNAVVGQTYTIYQILDLESYNPEKKIYAYKANPDWKDWLRTQTTYVSINDQGYVTWVKDADAAAFVKAAQEYAKANSITNQGSETANATTVSFPDLDLGYYLVDSTLGTLCSLDTTNPHVEMREKNEAPINVKTVEEDSTSQYGNTNDADIGQTVNFKSVITAQPGAENYVFHDIMSKGLTLDKASIKIDNVPVTGSDGSDADGDKYTVSYPSGEGADGCTFEIAFDQRYLNTITGPTPITITYSATLNENAVIAGEGNLNTSKLSYGDSSNTQTTPDSETRTYTWKLPIYKYHMDGETQKALAGAEFILYKGSEENRVYAQVAKGKLTGWTTTKTEATTLVSDTEGKIAVEGLDADIYYLEETKAPRGYNKLAGPVKVVISHDVTAEGTQMTHTLKQDTTDVVEVGIENQSGTELPETGGIGTTIFYVLGSILVIGAVVLLITKKRMSAAA